MELQIGALLKPRSTEGAVIGTDKFDYKVIQQAIGGRFERVFLNQEIEDMRIDAYCDEEGKIKKLDPSAVIVDGENILEVIAGPILFISSDDEGNSIGLSEEQKEYITNNLTEFCEATNVNNPNDTFGIMVINR